MLARLFTNDFKKGALFHIVKGQIVKNDTLKLSGIFTSTIGNYYFNGYISNGVLSATLTDGRHEHFASITGTKDKRKIIEEYASIFEESSELFKTKVYDPEIIHTREWKQFETRMKTISPKLHDDVELVFAFFLHARKLPFSHFALFKRPPTNPNDEEGTYEPLVDIEKISERTACLKIKSFGGTAREMDSVLQIVVSEDYENLIVDLRNNPGGSVAAGMAFAKRFVDTTIFGGVFLTQRWFNEEPGLPKLREYDELAHFSEANFNLIIQGIHREKGLCLKIVPEKEVFRGRVFILTNGNTASTCEPIVYGFKQYKLATVIGEKTAGAMLNGEFFELSSGFSLVVPTATYYASDGFKIDQNGVLPDINVKSAEALDYVLTTLLNQ